MNLGTGLHVAAARGVVTAIDSARDARVAAMIPGAAARVLSTPSFEWKGVVLARRRNRDPGALRGVPDRCRRWREHDRELLVHVLYRVADPGLLGRVHRVSLGLQLDMHYTKEAARSIIALSFAAAGYVWQA